jgi:hypothetical protein
MRTTTWLVRALMALSCLAACPVASEAKQCVWNNAGFILEVHWYREGDVLIDNARRWYIASKDATNREPVAPAQVDVFPVAQGRCWEQAERMITVLAIKDGGLVQPLLGAGVALVGVVAGAVGCVGTAGTACPIVIASLGVAVGTAVGMMEPRTIGGPVTDVIPHAFLVETPPPNNYLDVWGTVYEPRTGPGGPLTGVANPQIFPPSRLVEANGSAGWRVCATEGAACKFLGAGRVRYGANGVYAYKSLLAASGREVSIDCNNQVFGNPVVGAAKQCEVRADGAQSPDAQLNWRVCAPEGGTCRFAGTREVRYGANGSYIYSTGRDSIACNNQVFGDALFGVVKQCEVREPPAPKPPSQLRIK